jgi:hypothetical protein
MSEDVERQQRNKTSRVKERVLQGGARVRKLKENVRSTFIDVDRSSPERRVEQRRVPCAVRCAAPVAGFQYCSWGSTQARGTIAECPMGGVFLHLKLVNFAPLRRHGVFPSSSPPPS